VGSGQSGAQIAEELAASGREVLLATSRVPRAPRRYRGRDIHEWTVELGMYDRRTDQTIDMDRRYERHPMLSGARGGHTLALQQLARDGVRLLGRLVETEGDELYFASDLAQNMAYADQRAAGIRRLIDEHITATGIAAARPDSDPAEKPWTGTERSAPVIDVRAEQISTVIWATGFGPDVSWLDVPVLGHDGPIHTAGITPYPGLFAVGYPWLTNRGSGILYGVDTDATRIAQHAAAYVARSKRGAVLIPG
jgi:putative flavoprotein involved in K+ transport